MREQQLELIYSQSRLLYEIFIDVPWSILDKAKQKSRPHDYGIAGSAQENSTHQLSNQLQEFLIQQTMDN
jgi:hypothetical protein